MTTCATCQAGHCTHLFGGRLCTCCPVCSLCSCLYLPILLQCCCFLLLLLLFRLLLCITQWLTLAGWPFLGWLQHIPKQCICCCLCLYILCLLLLLLLLGWLCCFQRLLSCLDLSCIQHRLGHNNLLHQALLLHLPVFRSAIQLGFVKDFIPQHLRNAIWG